MADAYGSGPYERKFMQVQVLSPAPGRVPIRVLDFLCPLWIAAPPRKKSCPAARLQAPSLTSRCRYQLFAVEGHCPSVLYFVTPTQAECSAGYSVFSFSHLYLSAAPYLHKREPSLGALPFVSLRGIHPRGTEFPLSPALGFWDPAFFHFPLLCHASIVITGPAFSRAFGVLYVFPCLGCEGAAGSRLG